MNVMFLQDYKDDYRQYNNSQYGEVPDFVGYRLIREKIAVRAGFLVFLDPKRESIGNDLVSINDAVKRISTGCFLPNPEITLRLYAPTSINDYDWVGYTDYDFEFIEDIIQALPTDKRLLFWECVYNQYCKCTTNDYERHGRNKQDFEERLRLNKPTATPEKQQAKTATGMKIRFIKDFNGITKGKVVNIAEHYGKNLIEKGIAVAVLEVDENPETSSKAEPPETSSKQEKLTFIDIFNKNPKLKQCLDIAISNGYATKGTNGCYEWTSPKTHLAVFAEVLHKKGFIKTKYTDIETIFGVKNLPQKRDKAFCAKNYFTIKGIFESLISL